MYSSESNDIYRLYLEGAAEDMVTNSLTKLKAPDNIIQLFLKKENGKLIFKPEHVGLLYIWIRDQHADIRTLEDDYKNYQKFFQNVPLTDFKSYLDFTEKVHAKRDEAEYHNRHKNVGNIELEGSDKENIIENNDEILILKGDDEHKCVKYGKGYSFCISRGGGGNMYGNYRLSKASTFYFIFFKNIPKEDERHIMVLDRTDKGWEWTFGRNQTEVVHGGWNEIVKQFPILAKYEDKFVNKPLTPEEKVYQNKLRAFTKSPSSEKFKEFSYKEKSDVLKFGMLIPLDLFQNLDKYLRNEWISVGPKMSDDIYKLLNDKELERFNVVRKQQLLQKDIEDKYDFEICKNDQELYNKRILPDKKLCEQEEKSILYGLDDDGVYEGDLIIRCKYHFPNLDNVTEITGDLEVRSWALSLPNLQTSKMIDARHATNINLPKLYESLDINVPSVTTLNLPELQKSGNVIAYSATDINLPKLYESEDISAYSATTLNLPQLSESGSINASSVTTLNLPKLEYVKSANIYISRKTKKVILIHNLLNLIMTTTVNGDYTELFDERDNKPLHNIEIIEPSKTQENLNDSCVYDLMKSFLLKS